MTLTHDYCSPISLVIIQKTKEKRKKKAEIEQESEKDARCIGITFSKLLYMSVLGEISRADVS